MIALVESRQTSLRTKHIDLRFYYTQDKILDGTIAIEYCPTDKMIIEGLTKALALEQFALLWDMIMTPRIVADTLGGSLWTTMRRRLMEHPLGGGRQAANRRDIDKHGNGEVISLLLMPHHRR
jgi:hypothetical protein